MHVDVVPYLEEVKAEQITTRTVVIIDTFRASSSIVTALASGWREVIPAPTLGHAKQIQEKNPQFFLAGERQGKRILGLSYGNSPREFRDAPSPDATLVLTTSNGTRAFGKCQKAEGVLVSCFLNAQACAERIALLDRNVTLLCAGVQGEFALEDGIAAGCILHHLERQKEGELLAYSDLALSLRESYSSAKMRLSDVIASCKTAKHLAQLGVQEDLSYCLERDRFPVIPIYSGTSIRVN